MLTLTESAGIATYTRALASLMELAKTSSPGLYLEHFIGYTDLLEFKSGNGMLETLSIDEQSGLPSVKEISALKAERNNLGIGLHTSFSYEEIKGHIMRKVSEQDYDIDENLGHLTKRYYLSLLDSSAVGNDLMLTGRILEKGRHDDLIRFNITGYDISKSAFSSTMVEAYVPKRRLMMKNGVRKNLSEYHPAQHLRDMLTRNLGTRSNILFHNLSEMKIKARKISRSVIAPFYCGMLEPSAKMLEIDPLYPVMFERFNGPEEYVLAITTDTSTQNVNLFEDSAAGEKPLIVISSRYFCSKDLAGRMADIIPAGSITTL